MSLRNIAIIAHVDHGKTTLIDGLFKQAGLFAAHQKVDERVMDSGDIEKERGITISAKNAAFNWKGTRINIVDTPGHVDFGGEVERALFMVDGVLLLVDAAEGPLPQTRFVLRKALERKLKVIVMINKVDRPDARISEVEDKVMELFYDLATDDAQAEYTTFYGSAKQGWASPTADERQEDFSCLLDAIIKEVPEPEIIEDRPFTLRIADRKYDSFVGSLAIGRIESGKIKEGQTLHWIQQDGTRKPFTVTALQGFSGLKTERFESLSAGQIALIAGLDKVVIGETLADPSIENPLPPLTVDPPTLAVRLSVNTSPLAGREGTYLTSRKLQEVLQKEVQNNVALNYSATENPEVYLLKARGELQIVILLEELRREGFELMVGRPEILPLEKDGQKFEPQELFVTDLPEEFVGTITALLGPRGGVLKNMEKFSGSDRVRLEFLIPARGLIGLRSQILTQSRGEAIFSSSFYEYIPLQSKSFQRNNGALIADRSGPTTQYALFNLQPRGKLFVSEGIDVYEGMIIGEHSRQNDLNTNPTKEKKLTNVRASGTDDSTKLDPIPPLSLEKAIEWIDEDEWVEVTPENIRLRKAVLPANQRKVIRG